MERCIHLLASPDPRLRLLVLDTVADCCHVLQPYQGIYGSIEEFIGKNGPRGPEVLWTFGCWP